MIRLLIIFILLGLLTLTVASDKITETLSSISNSLSQAPESTAMITVGDLGSFFEGTSTHITNLITLYSIFISLILAFVSVVYFINHRKITDKMETFKENIKLEVEREVDRQFLYNAKKVMTEVQNDAYRKIDYSVDEISANAQKNIFDYQQLVYKVIQEKKYSIEEIINSKELNDHQILLEFVNIEGRYNETINHDLPNLFSTDIKGVVIPTIKKLSEFVELKDIIIGFIKELLEKDLAYVDSSKLKSVLNKYYQ